MNDILKEKLKTLPQSPGVYFHKAKSGEIIYVGKAAVLKNRVKQYFLNSKNYDIKTKALIDEIYDTDWVEVDSEVDALFLESEMVKRYKPRFNILLRDDKSQTFVKIDLQNDWPTVTFTRNPIDDGSRYFGPFYNGFAVKKALRYLRRVFPYYIKTPHREHNSLEVQIGIEPPLDMTSREYKINLKKLIKYIEGGRVKIIKEIQTDMNRFAKNQEFELAAIARNKLRYLNELQRKIMFGDSEFLDISKDQALLQITKLLGLKKEPARIEGYDISHMSGSNVVASMVVFINGVSSRENYRKFKMLHQHNNDVANIAETLTRRFSASNIKKWGLPDLILVDGGQPQLATAIKTLDLMGVFVPVVSIAKNNEEMVIAKNGFGIGSMYLLELIHSEKPKIGVIDSGGFYFINLHLGRTNAGGHSKNLRGLSTEYGEYDELLKLLQRVRDEAHRFAITYHSRLKSNSLKQSVLDGIPGVGPVTRKRLLKKFGSVRGIATSTDADLRQFIGPVIATRLRAHLKDLSNK